MNEIRLVYQYRVNIAKLTEDLQTELGDGFVGVSTGPGWVRVHLTEAPSIAEQEAVALVLDDHDPKQRSQIEQAQETRRMLIQQLARDDDTLQLTDFIGESAIVRKLARKVLLLEAQLRG